jgi:hypothetical protein
MSREFLLLNGTLVPRKEDCFIVCHLPSTGALKCGRIFPILRFIFPCCEEILQGGGSGKGGISPLSFPALHFPSWILYIFLERAVLSHCLVSHMSQETSVPLERGRSDTHPSLWFRSDWFSLAHSLGSYDHFPCNLNILPRYSLNSEEGNSTFLRNFGISLQE